MPGKYTYSLKSSFLYTAGDNYRHLWRMVYIGVRGYLATVIVKYINKYADIVNLQGGGGILWRSPALVKLCISIFTVSGPQPAFAPGLKKRFLKQKIGFQSILKLFSFNLQMPDKNYDPKAQRKVKTSTISKDSSMWTPQIAIHIWISFLLT